jgi:hypothetical protein
MKHRQMHGLNYTYKYTYTYSFFILCIEFHAARLHTKVCRSCSHGIKCWAGLLYSRPMSFKQSLLRKLTKENFVCSSSLISGFGGLDVACWPLVPKFVGSNPAEAVGFFGRKNPQHAFLRRGSKAVSLMSCFTACKTPQKWRGSRHFRQNSRPFLAYSSTFHCWVRERRFRRWGPLVAKVGTL